jgi:hypothetical protein
VLKRLGKYLNKLGKLTIYHSFILSNFNFCVCVLKWFGNSFHSLAAAYRKDFRPYLVVRTEGISVMLSYLKQYLVSLILIKSCKYEGLS